MRPRSNRVCWAISPSCVMARATDESQLGPLLPQADAIMVFHDLSILGEAELCAGCPLPWRGAAPVSAITTWISRPRPGTAWSFATCPTTARRKWPTTRSCSCWRSCAGSCRRTRRSGPARGTTGPRSAPPGCGARRSAWSAAAGSARRPRCEPRPSDSTSSSTIRTCARAWTRPWASAASTGSTSCSSRATSSACTAISTRRAATSSTPDHRANAPGRDPHQHGAWPDRRRGRFARSPRLGPHRRRRARRGRARAA